MNTFARFHVVLYTLLIGSIFCCVDNNPQKELKECYECDQIDSLIIASKSDQFPIDTKRDNLSKAYELTETLGEDSLKIDYLFHISNQLFSLKDYSRFKTVSSDFLKLSIKNNDSMRIGDFYWNMGYYYSTKEVLDSAYYNYGIARTIFEKLGHHYYTAKMEYNIAYVLRRSKNYIESEAYSFRSISNLKSLNKKLLLYRCYNHLGLLYNDLEEAEYSIEYHLKAMELIENLPKKGIYLERSLNNLSLVYQKQEKYLQAIETLDKALSNKTLKNKHANLYAKLVDNRAYNRFLNGEVQGVYHDFNSALNIRDSLGNEAGIGISNMHLAEYNLFNGDTLKAFAHAKQANDIALKLGLNRDILNSLALLSRANPGQATVYLNQYKNLNDSLLLEERKVRDKFTRIQFETEGYIDANKDLKKKNVWISLTSMLALASISLLFFVYRQKSKNRSLVLEQKQQKANEEIYDLMLKQQNREEEGRIQERVRISEELHDGVLARLFSVRISLGFLKVRGNNKEEDKFDLYKKELQIVEKEIRTLSHALKNDELSSKKDFPKLLSELLEEQSVIGDFTYVLEEDSAIAWNLVDEKLKINLYRIVQEAICNIIKYADCQKVEVSLSRKNKKVELLIVDDGKGFDTNTKNKGIGLKNMSSRAKSIGACNSISSSLDKGTKIIVSIPTKILYHGAKTQSIDY